ncbi:LuxR family transcriptional regulator [Asanoa ishikariensis]|uniref:Predicted ATPase n=1 Tax=Asanoa ishikariensis TaxID=137265 RepID=A0A1H3U8Z4_9ACTN|nr:LuxR family transcriptional regulator [Asanoa ishikariensis]GIF64074.1 LuxR family transcriptional regulator [Asanoa ishikariensis]SDZ58757.1 Predicted ATPase [Asanoa ishikariensis]
MTSGVLAARLVGRSAELDLLQAAITAAPSVALVEGEAGIGKSRLVRELLTVTSGRRVLIGQCEQLQEPLPLSPLLDAFRQAGPELGGPLNPVIGALAPLLPELAAHLPAPPPALSDPGADRHRVFRAAVALLEELGPLLLVLEDVHWADTVTFDFLAFLAAHLPPDLALVITARTETGRLPIREALARAPSGAAHVVGLRPLRPPEVAQLAGEILDAAPAPGFADRLYEKTGGIPFVVEEVLRTYLKGPGALSGRPEALDDLAVPTVLRDVILQRLLSLDDDAREIVQAAAVVGLVADDRLLAEVTGRDSAEIARALAGAQDVGLLQEDGFRHALARQVVYESAPAAWRRWLHLRTGRALESTGSSARLAHHYLRAGHHTEMVTHAEAAAETALAHGNDATAARFLLAALGADGVPQETRVRLAVKLGRAAVDGLAHAEALPIVARLLTTEQLPAAVRGELRFAYGRLLRQSGDTRAGHLEIERAVEDLAGAPALLGRALAVLAAPETVTDRHVREHLARCDEAAAAARRSGDRGVDLAVRITRAGLLLELGQPAGWPLVEDLLDGDDLRSSPRECARACLNWAQGALHAGRLDHAEALLATGRQVADQVEYLRIAVVLDLVTALVDYAAGRWDGLLDRARLMGATHATFGAASLDSRLLLGALLAAIGPAEEAADCFGEVITVAEQVGTAWPLISARTAMARLLLTLDDANGAADHARAAITQVRAKGNWVWGGEAVLCLVDAVGRTDEAEAVVVELAAGLAGTDAPRARSALLAAQAVLAPGDADRLLVAARGVAGDAGLTYDEARATERLGGLRCAHDDPRGGEDLETALRLYGALHATRDIARVCRAMRLHNVPIPYPWRGGRPALGHTLSAQEHRVALLAAAGRTNQEIATELFLSRRTVESHVSSALRKLGCTSRKDLTGILDR